MGRVRRLNRTQPTRRAPKKITGGVVAGVGAVALAGGLIWYFVQPRSAETAGSLLKPNVTPAVTPGFAGLALSGAF